MTMGTLRLAPPPRQMIVSAGTRAVAEHSPEKIALTFGERALSYGELVSRMSCVAGGAIASLGLTHGSRAVLFSPNCLEYPEIICGLADAGMIVVTANPRLTSKEIEAIGRDCEPELVFVHAELEPIVAAANLPSAKRVIVIGADYEEWLKGCTPAGVLPALSETDPFALVYTSGTTGKPKGVLLSHRSRALSFFGMAMEFGCFSPDDRQLAIAPMAHGAGFVFTMAPLFFGGFVEVLGKFDPELVLRRLAEGDITGTFMVPTHYQSIFSLDQSILDRYLGTTPKLRSIISNASALPQAVKEKIVAYWGNGLLHETYGSTEAGFVTNLRPASQLEKTQCVGRPFTCTNVQLLDEDGKPVPTGEVGELYSTSPFLFNGYYRQPEATAECMRDGAVSVGDLARQDEEGYYYIVDRKNDLVISGGINIYPREIEEVLHQHPDIREAAVIGVPDERWGESLRAFIVAQAGAALDEKEIERHCRGSLAGFKIPRSIRLINQLPRNAGGKVLKNELRND